jgi:hypothetical protein
MGDVGVEFTRSSVGTYVGSDGLIKTAVDDEARFDHDPVTGESLGLLMEESRTNSVTTSGDVKTAAPSTITGTSSYVTGIAPDGSSSTTLTNWVPDSGSTSNALYGIASPGTPAAASVFIKANGWNYAGLWFNNIDGSADGKIFIDLTTGEVLADGNMSSTTVVKCANGWWRVGGSSSTNALGTLSIQCSSSSGSNTTPAMNGTDGILVWGLQTESGTFVTSLIPTSGSTAARSPDIAQVTTADIYGDEFTIINKPFGVSSGSDTLHIQGQPYVERSVVYNENLSQEQINAFVDKTDEFWQWRILGSSFALPTFTTDGQVTVDWGDGTVETLTTSEHTFTNGGGYHDVGFRLDSGTNFYPTLNNNATHKDKVIAVGPGPESMKVDLANMLEGASNLVSIDSTISLMSASNRKIRESICLDCTSLKSFPYIDFSGASPSSIRFAWKNCTSMESFPLLDLSQADNLGDAGGRGTWKNCSSLKSFPAIDFPNVIRAFSAWESCSSMTEFNATGFGLCITFYSAWYDCSSLTSFPLIDTSSGTNFTRTWRSCSSLTTFPLIDTSSGTTFSETWYGCSSLTSFPLINTSLVTTLSFAWYSCSSLTSFPTPSGNLMNFSSVTEFREAWRVCSSLTSFPVIDVSSGTSFYMTWRSCSGLTSFPALDFTLGQDFYFCWNACSNLVDFPAGCWDNWNPASVSNNVFDNAFDACSSLSATSVENILNSIDTSGQSAPASGVDITIDYNAGSGTPSISTAVTNLKSRGWTITLNGVAQ